MYIHRDIERYVPIIHDTVWTVLYLQAVFSGGFESQSKEMYNLEMDR